MKKAPVLYVAHAISYPISKGTDNALWREHYLAVCAIAAKLADMRVVPSVPALLPGVDHTKCLNVDKELVDRADGIAVYVDPERWVEDSVGVKREIMWAKRQGKPVFWIEDGDVSQIKKWRRTWKET